MLRRFCKNLERHCLMVFLLSVAMGISIYLVGAIRWVIIEPGVINHSVIVLMALSGVGLGMISSTILFGFFGRYIRMLIRAIDDFTYQVSNDYKRLIAEGIHKWKENNKKNRLMQENKLLSRLEDLDMKVV